MSLDENSDLFIINYIEGIPKYYANYYLESRSISGFAANILDEIQDLLKQINFLETSIVDIKELVMKESLNNKRKIKKIESLKLENEELHEIIRNNEDLHAEYRKMLEREGETRCVLCSKLLEKENEIEECMQIIEKLNKKIVSFEQMKKFQNTQIIQLKDSITTCEIAASNANFRYSCNSSIEGSSPLLRKFTRDIDVLTYEKDQLANSLNLKNEEYETLEQKYLKLLRKHETLIKLNQQQEVKLLENNQEIMSLKSRLKTLKNSLKFANKKIFEKLDKTRGADKRKVKSLLIQPSRQKFRNGSNNEYQVSQLHFAKKSTLLDEIPTFYSPKMSTFNLDFTNKDERSSQHSHQSYNGHMHQESFGLQNKAIQIETINLENCVNLNLKEESPKFARSQEEMSFSMKSSSTIEVDPSNKNPHPKSRSSNEDYISSPVLLNIPSPNNNYEKGNKTIFNIFLNKTDQVEETRKKLIEIEKKGPVIKEPPLEQSKSSSNIQNFMKMTLNMIPSGTFFTKIMDFSEDILNK